jgi:hypothetical protein
MGDLHEQDDLNDKRLYVVESSETMLKLHSYMCKKYKIAIDLITINVKSHSIRTMMLPNGIKCIAGKIEDFESYAEIFNIYNEKIKPEQADRLEYIPERGIHPIIRQLISEAGLEKSSNIVDFMPNSSASNIVFDDTDKQDYMSDTKRFQTLDINKHYSHCVKTLPDTIAFPKITEHSHPDPYNNDPIVANKLYYLDNWEIDVCLELPTIARGAGWYFAHTVNWVLARFPQKKPFNITHEMRSDPIQESNTDPLKNLFVKLDEHLPHSKTKEIKNSLIGTLGKKVNRNTDVIINPSDNNARELLQNGYKPISIDGANIFYKEFETPMTEHYRFVRNAILSYSDIVIQEWIDIIKNKGAKPIWIKTDAIAIDLQNAIIPHGTEEGALKYESYVVRKNYKTPADLYLDRCDKPSNHNYKFNHRDIDIPTYTTKKLINDILEREEGHLITGWAGAGKTYTLNQLITELEKTNIPYIAMAHTHKAITHIKTDHKTTMDKAYHRISKKKSEEAMIANKIVLLDEISMFSMKNLILFARVKAAYPKTKFIGFGDKNQLPPIDGRYEQEENHTFKWIFDYNRTNLTHNYRSDACINEWQRQINDPESNDDTLRSIVKELPTIDGINETAVHYCFMNKTRRFVNEKVMDKLFPNSKPINYDTKWFDKLEKIDQRRPQPIKLEVGLKLQCWNSTLNYKNSDKYTVIITNKDQCKKREQISITLKSDKNDDIVEIGIDKLFKHFVPSYCCTLHTAQGDTVSNDQKVVLHDIGAIITQQDLNKNLLVVALTRAEKYTQICKIGHYKDTEDEEILIERKNIAKEIAKIDDEWECSVEIDEEFDDCYNCL